MAGHAGGGVVQNNDGGVALVVGDVGQAGHAGVHEGGVPQHRHGLALAGLAQGLVKAVDGAHRGPHALAGLNGVEGLVGRQGVAADVPQYRDLVLGQGVEQPPVGTSGAQHRGTGGHRLVQGHPGFGGLSQLFGHQALGELPDEGQGVLPLDGEAQVPAVLLDHRVQLLQHQ